MGFFVLFLFKKFRDSFREHHKLQFIMVVLSQWSYLGEQDLKAFTPKSLVLSFQSEDTRCFYLKAAGNGPEETGQMCEDTRWNCLNMDYSGLKKTSIKKRIKREPLAAYKWSNERSFSSVKWSKKTWEKTV